MTRLGALPPIVSFKISGPLGTSPHLVLLPLVRPPPNHKDFNFNIAVALDFGIEAVVKA